MLLVWGTCGDSGPDPCRNRTELQSNGILRFSRQRTGEGAVLNPDETLLIFEINCQSNTALPSVLLKQCCWLTGIVYRSVRATLPLTEGFFLAHTQNGQPGDLKEQSVIKACTFNRKKAMQGNLIFLLWPNSLAYLYYFHIFCEQLQSMIPNIFWDVLVNNLYSFLTTHTHVKRWLRI